MPPKKNKTSGRKDKKKGKSSDKILGPPKTPRPSPNITEPSFSLEPEISIRLGASLFANPWKEWGDQELNNEHWFIDTLVKLDFDVTKPKRSSNSSAVFIDPATIIIPQSLSSQLDAWRRPSELYNKDDIVIYDDTAPAYSDLTTLNKHIINSEFMREFMSAVCLLQYLGVQDVFPIEGVNDSFNPSTKGLPWQPWHHIYSLCKSGKDEQHIPLVNQSGKYVVRLYFLGCWRRIYVDDTLPVDKSETSLLPRTFLGVSNSETHPKQELWPALLCKALLKIAALSWDDQSELKDFNIFQCLTGWYMQEIDLKDMNYERFWGYLQTYCDELKVDSEAMESEHADTDAKKRKKKEKQHQKEPPKYVCGVLKDLRTVPEEILPALAPCFSHYVLIRNIRNITWKTEDSEKELSNWQYFRWVPWAMRHDVYNPMPAKTIRVMLVTSFMKKCAECIINTERKETPKVDDKIASQAIPPESNKTNKTGKAQKLNKDKADKSKKGKGKPKGKPKLAPVPLDPSEWLNFEEIREHFSKIIIFKRPSTYKYNIMVSDYARKTPNTASVKSNPKDKKVKKKKVNGKADKHAKEQNIQQPEETNIVWPNSLQIYRNVPAYILLDNLEPVKLVINFSHLNSITQEDFVGRESICTVMLGDDEAGIRENREEILPSLGYIIFEKFRWDFWQYLPPQEIITTLGSTSREMELGPGRHVFRVWLKSNTTYSLHILCNNKIFFGSFERISQVMNFESCRLLKLSFDMSDKFYDLIYSLGTKNYPAAIKAFYNSCKYDHLHRLVEDNEHIPDKLYGMLFEELLEILKEDSTEEEIQTYIRSLRILFLDPYISDHKTTQEVVEEVDTDEMDHFSIKCTTFEDYCYQNFNQINNVGFQDKEEKAAICIQNFFKLIFVKKLKSYHSFKHPGFRSIFDNLKNIFDKVFSDTRREICVPTMFRKLSKKSKNDAKLERLVQNCYPCCSDFRSIVRSHQYQGIVKQMAPKRWIALIKVVFFVHSETLNRYRLEFYCPFEKFMVKTFNNDNGKKVKGPIVNLKQNQEGYTIVAFAWNRTADRLQDIPCKLVVYRSPLDELPHICDNLPPSCTLFPAPQLAEFMIRNNYIPNVNDIVAKCLIKIKHNADVTLTWTLSSEEAKVRVKIISENGSIIKEQIGRGTVIMPSLLLEYRRGSDTNISIDGEEEIHEEYYIENTVKDNRLKRLQKPSLNPKTKQYERNESKMSLASEYSKDFSIQETVYKVEITVLENSWPLLNDEWNMAITAQRRYYLKMNLAEENYDIDSDTSAGTGYNIQLTDNEKSNPSDMPWWEMRLFAEDGDAVVLEEDHTRQQEILEMKRQWESEQPGRMNRGENLRLHFLENTTRGLFYSLPEEVSFEQENVPEDASDFEDIPEEKKPNYDNSSATSVFIPDKDIFKKRSRTSINPYSSVLLKTIPALPAGFYSINPRLFTEQEGEVMKYTRMIAERDFELIKLLFESRMSNEITQRRRRNWLLLQLYSDIMTEAKGAEELGYLQREQYIKSVIEIKKRRLMEEALELKKRKEEEKAAKKKEKAGTKGKKEKAKKDKRKKKY